MIRAAGRLVGAVALVLVAGCQSAGERAAERLRADVAAYASEPSEARRAQVEAGFARLEAEIAARRAEAARQEDAARTRTEVEVAALERTRDELRADYLRAQARAVTDAAEDAVRSVGESIGRGLEEAGKRIRDAARGTPPDTPPSDPGE
jgi:hypothetical protein